MYKNNYMPKKKNPGRPKKSDSDKVKTEYVYIKKADKKKIEAKFGDLTKALTEGVLPEC